MEKFARQAIVDGVSDVKDMSVTRDSEVFRALNMHYNKANDFQVRFLSYMPQCSFSDFRLSDLRFHVISKFSYKH